MTTVEKNPTTATIKVELPQPVRARDAIGGPIPMRIIPARKVKRIKRLRIKVTQWRAALRGILET